MTDRHYKFNAGEFVDYETLDDAPASNAAKDVLIASLTEQLRAATTVIECFIEMEGYIPNAVVEEYFKIKSIGNT